MSVTESTTELRRTPLASLHEAAGARMVPFAGYAMPVQYPTGILAEHGWTRTEAGLFDVSHMGQATLRGRGVAAGLEELVAADVAGLSPGQQRYTQLLNEEGGILDDLMVARASPSSDELSVVVNAGTKEADYRHLAANLPAGIELETHDDRALLALQGPAASAALAGLAPGAERLAFMTGMALSVGGIPAYVTRSGYTGEVSWLMSCP